MKIIKIVMSVCIVLSFVLGSTSCIVTERGNNGRHVGWFKGSYNPNPGMPGMPGNPGHGHGRGRGK